MASFLADVPRFLLVGALATATQYVVLGVVSVLLGTTAAAAAGAGYFAGSLVSYQANHSFTFRSREAHGKAVPRFYFMVAAAWVLTVGLMGLLVDWLGWNLWLSQVITTVICIAFNYTCSRIWVFKVVS